MFFLTDSAIMIEQVFDCKVCSVLGDERLKLLSVIQSWYYTNKVREDVVNMCGVEMVFAVVRGFAGPSVKGRIMTFGSVRLSVFVVSPRICGALLLEEFRSSDSASVFAG